MSKRNKKIENKEPEKERNADGLQFRQATVTAIRADGDNGEITVNMSVSSEAPVLTYARYNDTWQYVYEILDHSPSSIKSDRMKDGLVIQDTHWGDQVGLIRNPQVTDGKLGGTVEFCTGERAQDIARDAEKGLRKNCSVGYIVNMDSYELEGEKDGYPVVRAKVWTPYEASFVPVPADTSVGVGRELKNVKTPKNEKERNMNPKDIAALFKRAAENGIEASKVNIEFEDIASAERALDTLIMAKQKSDLDASRAEVQELKERKAPEKPEMPAKREVAPIGGSVEEEKKITRKYSVMNVLRHAAGLKADAFGNKVDIGFETEINDECRSLGLGSTRGGTFIIPHAVLANKRDLSVSGTSSATVATDLMADEFIDMLRSKVILGELGCQFMNGLVGNVAIPKQSGTATGYWVAEAGTITESAQTLGQVTGTPHTCGALVDITRRMLLQSTPAAENLVRNDILSVIARTVQTAVFAGTGADGQPSAITNASGINNPTVTEGTPTYAQILSFIEAIETDNASGMSMKWAMTAEVWAKLASTFTNATYGEIPLIDWATKSMLGYGYAPLCSDLPANSLWFGDWSSVVVGIWGAGIDLNLDTATLSNSGGLRVVGLQDVDVMVRNGQALAYNTAVTA